MGEKEYTKLNNYLNDVFIELENINSFLLRNIYNISKLNDNFKNFISNFELNEKSIKKNLTFQEMYVLAREIIGSIDKKYLLNYDKIVETGILDINYDNEEDANSYYDRINKTIYIDRVFDYTDVISLVHEYFHFTNINDKTTINCHVLTEFISIYSEIYSINYLLTKGIPKEEIPYNKRLVSTKRISKKLYSYELILLAYEKFGLIDSNTIEMLNKYICDYEKNDFEKDCIKLLERFEKVEQTYLSTINSKKQFNYNELQKKLCVGLSSNYRYILGTILAFYAIKYCDKKDIVYLNDNINTYEYANMNLYSVLLSIGIDLDKESFNEEAFRSIYEYINNNDKTLKKSR